MICGDPRKFHGRVLMANHHCPLAGILFRVNCILREVLVQSVLEGGLGTCVLQHLTLPCVEHRKMYF